MEDTAIIGMVKQHQLELEQAEERTFDTGFLKTNFRQPMSPLFMPAFAAGESESLYSKLILKSNSSS